MCRAMPFSARALKENIFFDHDIAVKKHNNVKIEIWFIVVGTLIAVLFLFLSSPWGSVYRFCTVTLIDNECMSLLFPQTFCIVFVCSEILQKFLKGKSDAYK